MAKTPTNVEKAAAESPADRLKREIAEKAAASKPIPDQNEDTDVDNKPEPESLTDAELAALEADRVDPPKEEHGSKEPYDDNPDKHPWNSTTQLGLPIAGSALDKLHKMAQLVPVHTENEHVLFGLGGVTFTVGDLRALTGMKRN